MPAGHSAKPPLPELLPDGKILVVSDRDGQRHVSMVAPSHHTYSGWLAAVQRNRRATSRRSVTYGIWMFVAQYALLQLVVAVLAFIVLVVAFPDVFH
jgi:hypothetical protein